MRLFAALLSLVLLAVATAVPAGAEDTPPPVKGLFLLTDYPAITVRPGTTTTDQSAAAQLRAAAGALYARG